MKFSENEFRDHLFNNHRDTIGKLIIGRRKPVSWNQEGFPPIRFLLQQLAEHRINQVLDGLDSLVLTAKELRLARTGDSTTRIDLFGTSESNGLTIIELKKSRQTERQAYTALLAYANHFCSIFPGANENVINSVLVAPMETRTVRDAFAQEVILNRKATAALMPKDITGRVLLEAYYPDESYYRWFENNLLDDRSMFTVALSFQALPGWIDSDTSSNGGSMPEYSKSALNTVASTISSRLQSDGFHSMVYASQKWGEIGALFPFPNAVIAVFVNPFASFRTGVYAEDVHGESDSGRIEEVQSILNQLTLDEKDSWLDSVESSFQDNAIRTTRLEFEKCFQNSEWENVETEISLPNWNAFSMSLIDAVWVHNLDVYRTGLLREVYLKYTEYIYKKGNDPIYYSDDLPKYSYLTFRKFMAAWEILSGLGLGEEHA